MAAERRRELPEIRVWDVRPGSCAGEVVALSNEELAQVERLPSARQQIYIAARTALRLVLSRELEIAPRRIAFERRCRHCGDASHGKPVVVGAPHGADFSISYSEQGALVAFTTFGRVGVDIEALAVTPITHRWCFSAPERAYLAALNDGARDEATVTAWARKEAVAKADGRGLAFPLADVVVTGPRASWKLPMPWQLYDLPLGGTRAAAIAYDAPGAQVHVEHL